MTETQDAIEILDDLFGDTPGYREAVAKEVTNSHVARLIYKARNEAGLSQQGLADKIGSRQSVISRLEKADYSGHSLSILQKIVSALGLKLVIEIVKPDEVAVISHAAV